MNPHLISTGIAEMLPMARTGEPLRHVSAVIRSLCLQLGHFTDTDNTATPEELAQRQTRFELGNAFEDALVAAMVERHIKHDPNRYCRPGELEKDGLVGTPDLLDLSDPRGIVVSEVKLTWASSRHGVDSEQFWRYWVQLKAYCYLVETYVGRLHVCHLNGDYKADRGPTYNVWEDTFTRNELHDNWRMLKTESDRMVRDAARQRKGRKS